MCPECSGLGKVMTLDLLPLIAEDKSWNEGMVELPTFRVGNWYWKQYTDSGLFDLEKNGRTIPKENGIFCCTVQDVKKRIKPCLQGLEIMMMLFNEEYILKTYTESREKEASENTKNH